MAANCPDKTVKKAGAFVVDGAPVKDRQTLAFGDEDDDSSDGFLTPTGSAGSLGDDEEVKTGQFSHSADEPIVMKGSTGLDIAGYKIRKATIMGVQFGDVSNKSAAN